MDNATYAKIKEVIDQHNRIGIVVGRNPNLDQMGAALALYLSLTGMGKQVVVASPSEPVVGISSLVGIDKVKTALDSEGGDLVVAFPYKEGEIDKVSYTIEEGFLNIVVKAGANGLSFNEKDVQFKRSGNAPTLLFVIGTSRLSDLGKLFNTEALKETVVINIDNKSDNQGFGDIVLVSPRNSSVSEQVAAFLNVSGYAMDIDIAQNLLSGISFATSNFQKPSTSSLAFEMAGVLMRSGAVRGKQRVENMPRMSQMEPQVQQSNQQYSNIDDYSFQPAEVAPAPEPIKETRQQPGGQQPQQMQQQQKQKGKNPPPDWLMPKVYRGSTTV